MLLGSSLEVQWLGLGTFTAGARVGVQPLFWELRSHKTSCKAKKEKKRKTFSQIFCFPSLRLELGQESSHVNRAAIDSQTSGERRQEEWYF